MPPRPTGGGRPPTPPRRSGQQLPKQAPKQAPKLPGKPAAKPTAKPGQPSKAQQAQTRQAAELQRRAAKAATQRQQHRQRQQVFLREAHTERRQAAAQQRTEQIREQVRQLESILSAGLRRSARIDLESLYQSPPAAVAFDPGPLGVPVPEPSWEEFTPGGLAGWLGGQSRRERQQEATRRAWEQAREQWQLAERERQERLASAERAHEAEVAAQREQVDEYNFRVARVAAGLRTREPAAVASFLRTVLRRVPLPAGFPGRAQVDYQPAAERAVLRVVLPDRAVVPTVSGYHYQAAPDEMFPTARPPGEVRELYRRVLAQVALLVVRDVLQAEPGLFAVTLHGLVDRLDPASGEPGFACVLRIDADRASFEALELAQTAAEECLRQLGAEFSPDPYGRQPLAEIARGAAPG
jgi:restriction system protein